MNDGKGAEIVEAWVRINSKSFSVAIYIYTHTHTHKDTSVQCVEL